MSSMSFLGGHDIVARAVYNGLVDVGAGHDGVLTDLARSYGYGDADDRMVRLAWTDPIPSDPVVVNIPDSNRRQSVITAIQAAGQDAAIIANAIAVFWGGSTGLAATSAGAYNVLDVVLRELAFGEEDLLS